MSAVEALKAARGAGIRLRLDGDDLMLEAAEPPSEAVLALLSRDKPGIVALLRPSRNDWSAEDWQAFFDERAGIAEFDSGLPRAEAETRAFVCCVAEWLKRNFVPSPPEACLACGGADGYERLLPFGVTSIGHAWLHSRCWPAWHVKREAEAVAALKAMGIAASVDYLKEAGRNMNRRECMRDENHKTSCADLPSFGK